MSHITRDLRRAAFSHVLTELWGEEESMNVYQTFIHEGYELRVEALHLLTREDVATMQYKDEYSEIVPAPKAVINGRLRVWKLYLAHMIAMGKPVELHHYVR